MFPMTPPLGFRKPAAAASGITIRSQSIVALANTTPRVLAFPAGAAVGDRLIIFGGASWAISTPAGWTSHDSNDGTQWNGETMSKVLTSGDIATGSVSVTLAGSHGNVFWLVCMVGAPSIRTVQSTRTASGATSRTVTTASATPQIGDKALFFGSGRWTATGITLNRGAAETAIATAGGVASGRGFSETLSANGVVAATWTYTPATNGDYQSILVLSP